MADISSYSNSSPVTSDDKWIGTSSSGSTKNFKASDVATYIGTQIGFGSAGGDLTGSYPDPDIAAGAVTLLKMASLSANSIIGNNTGSLATPIALSGTNVTAMLNIFSTTSTTKGLVTGSNNLGASYYLNGSGAWTVPFSTGTKDVNVNPYTPQIDDYFVTVNYTGAGVYSQFVIPSNATVPFPIGHEIVIANKSSTKYITVASSGAPIVAYYGTGGQDIQAGSVKTLKKVDTNTWFLY